MPKSEALSSILEHQKVMHIAINQVNSLHHIRLKKAIALILHEEFEGTNQIHHLKARPKNTPHKIQLPGNIEKTKTTKK